MEIFLNTLLWLIVSSLVVGGLWFWLKPYPHNPLRGSILAAQILIAAAVPVMLLAMIWFKPDHLGFIALYGSMLLVAWILLSWGSARGAAYEQEIRQLEAGQALARWDCTVAEYRFFLKSELARLRSDVKLFILYSFGFAGAAMILFPFLFRPLGWMMGGLLLAAGLFVSLGSYLQFLRVKARHDADDLEADEVLFGPKGVFMFGRFIPLRGFNLWLEKVAYIAQEPPRRHFVAAARGRYGTSTMEVYISVPRRYWAEAKTLVAKYKNAKDEVNVNGYEQARQR